MTARSHGTEAATLPRPSAPAGPRVVDGSDGQAEPVEQPSAWQRRELASLALRFQEQRPEIPLADVTSLVEQEYAKLAPSRVQGFRMILTERAVRRRLTSGLDPRHA